MSTKLAIVFGKSFESNSYIFDILILSMKCKKL